MQRYDIDNVLILKTNVNDLADVNAIRYLFDANNKVKRWSVDCEDVDKVLRIESDQLSVAEVIEALAVAGFEAEELID